MSKELSIFIDESGDFGEYAYHSPYYIVALVFHEQDKPIDKNINKLDDYYKTIGFTNEWIHTAPLVRHEEDYVNYDLRYRQKILSAFIGFARTSGIKHESFYIEKKHIEDEVIAISKLSKQMSQFLKDNLEYFNSFDTIKIYYDNGQTEVTKMVSSIFNTLFSNVEFRKVIPSSYKLFQVADLICYFKLISLKIQTKSISFNELRFFGNISTINKNYIKPLRDLHF